MTRRPIVRTSSTSVAELDNDEFTLRDPTPADKARFVAGTLFDLIEKLIRHTGINPNEREQMLAELAEAREVSMVDDIEPLPELGEVGVVMSGTGNGNGK